jgi:lipopolysaccharide/colanic/teichoic acid biosynthesis glycosyltransferase
MIMQNIATPSQRIDDFMEYQWNQSYRFSSAKTFSGENSDTFTNPVFVNNKFIFKNVAQLCEQSRQLPLYSGLTGRGASMKRRTILVVKRLIDIVGSTLIFIFAFPVVFSIAVAVKLTSRGPILYRQRRMGMLTADGKAREFYVYKFRTMTVDAEAKSGAVLAGKNDIRVTKVGRILRATRLDELPQMLNVLLGDMSIVGPRPERPELMAPLNFAVPFFEERLRFVKPGITGLAQVNLKYDGQMGEDDRLIHLKPTLVNPFGLKEMDDSPADGMRLKLLYDMAYSASLEGLLSFLITDFSIMFKTPIVMFLRRTGR